MQTAFAQKNNLRFSFKPAHHQAPLQGVSRTARDMLEFMWLVSKEGKSFAKCSQQYLADHFNCSWRTAHRRINELKEKGFIFPVTRNDYMVVQWAVSLIPKFTQESATNLPMVKWTKGHLQKFWTQKKEKKEKINAEQNQGFMTYPPDKNVIDKNYIHKEGVQKSTPPLVTLNETNKLANTNNGAILTADCHPTEERKDMQDVTQEEISATSQSPHPIQQKSAKSKALDILNNQEIDEHKKLVKLIQLREDLGKPLHEELTQKLFRNTPEALKLIRQCLDTSEMIETLVEASDAFNAITESTPTPPPTPSPTTNPSEMKPFNLYAYLHSIPKWSKHTNTNTTPQ